MSNEWEMGEAVDITGHIVDANKKVPEWDKDGNPRNLLAAAEDAYDWLAFFSSAKYPTKQRLNDAKDELRKFLDEAQK